MRLIGLFVLVLIACSGCATNKPLKSVSDANHMALNVQRKNNESVHVLTETVMGPEDRQIAVAFGYAGDAILHAIATSPHSHSRAVLNEVLQKTPAVEQDVLAQAIKQELTKGGFALSDQDQKRTLTFRLNSMGLRELQTDFWLVFAVATAELKDSNQKTIWSATVNANSTKLRNLDDFSRNPQLYVDDFQETCQDAARQLVTGPIRRN